MNEQGVSAGLDPDATHDLSAHDGCVGTGPGIMTQIDGSFNPHPCSFSQFTTIVPRSVSHMPPLKPSIASRERLEMALQGSKVNQNASVISHKAGLPS
jgi:hypothetical protein